MNVEKYISQENIKQFVDELLKDKNVNLKYLPDSFEKKLYTDILSIILAILENILEDISIKFLGHEIKLNFQPIKQEEEPPKEE